MNRNYASISPSALSLLKMKAHTSIPFAKEAAALVQKYSVRDAGENAGEPFYYWMRVMHFELRYASINDLLAKTSPKNILELSSGYSFRGLDFCLHNDAHYIDTDLPDVINLKTLLQKEMVDNTVSFKGKLETVALNALDEENFDATVARFGDGPVTIVNEGLLMYLNNDEKKKLCGIIHKHLRQRGGYWITADIYIQSPESEVRNLKMSKEQEAFFSKHNIDQNKFESEAAAEDFFKREGFEIDAIAHVDPSLLSSYHHLLQYVPEEIKRAKKPMPRIQNTWRLKAI